MLTCKRGWNKKTQHSHMHQWADGWDRLKWHISIVFVLSCNVIFLQMDTCLCKAFEEHYLKSSSWKCLSTMNHFRRCDSFASGDERSDGGG